MLYENIVSTITDRNKAAKYVLMEVEEKMHVNEVPHNKD